MAIINRICGWIGNRIQRLVVQKGQSLVEMALFFPILLLLLAGLIEVGLYANNYLTVLDASREGARLGSDGDPDPNLQQVWTHDGGVRNDPITLCKDGPDVSNGDPDVEITDVYFQIACLAYRDMHPLEITTDTNKLNDIVVTIYAVAPLTDTYEIKVRPNITDDIDIIYSRFGISPTHIHDGYYSWLNNFDPENPAYENRLKEEDIRNFLDANPPSGAIAFIAVEMWWEHELLLNLAVTQAFIPDPLLIHTHTIMPISAAEPTPTAGPSPTPGDIPTATPQTVTPSPTPTETGTPTSTPTETHTPTNTPTETSTPTETPTPTPTATPDLPVPWQHKDVGDVGVAGSAGFSGGEFTVSGSGEDILGSDDEFHFVYQPAAEDYCQITARILSQTNTHGWAKAGVMFKQSTISGSNYALMGVTQNNGMLFQWNYTNFEYGTNYSFPIWVQLVRNGTTLTGYYSTDGINWIEYATRTVSLTTPAVLGLFVTSHNDSELSTVRFDNVSVVCASIPTQTPTPTQTNTPTETSTPTETPTPTATPLIVPIKINFQPSSAVTPVGYLVDSGSAFGDRGNGYTYGWNSSNGNTRERNADDDQRLDTLNHMNSFTWEIELPPDNYIINLGMGDPSYTDSINHIFVEGIEIVDLDGGDYFDINEGLEISVTDGKLTLVPASGSYVKILYIDIIPTLSITPTPTPSSTPSPTPTPTITCGGLVQEAETGVLSEFTIGSDAAASNGAYIHIPDGAGDSWSIDEDRKATYCVTLDEIGIFRIIGWVYAADGGANSFYVTVDGVPAEGYLWDTEIISSYEADYVNDRNSDDPIEVILDAGNHIVTFYAREDGTRLDKFEFEFMGGPTPTPTPTPTATIPPTPESIAVFPMDADPGWTTEGEWAFGVPTGLAGDHGLPDPTSGATGSFVYGYNLGGGYTDSMPEYALTTGPIDCSGYYSIELKFSRWLNVERSAYDHASILASNDGVNWATIWENPDVDVGSGASVADSSWTDVSYDISSVADGNMAVYIRWVMGTSDGGWTYSGWNIDDVEIIGMALSGDPPNTPVNLMPSPGGTVLVQNPMFSWSAFSDPDDGDSQSKFHLMLRRANGTYFSLGSHDTGLMISDADNFTPTDWSLPDGEYCWRVRVSDSMSWWSEFSAETCFTVDTGFKIIASYTFDSMPEWTAEGQWQFGVPTGGMGDHGVPDPTSGYTGNYVYGYNLNGGYQDNMAEYSLTTEAYNCGAMENVTLKFMRWLNVEISIYDHAYLRVSTDGSTWTTIWENPATEVHDGASVADTSWQEMIFDISSVADHQTTVYIRWVMGTSDGGWNYSGWNIDDVEITGNQVGYLNEDFESYTLGDNPDNWLDQRQSLENVDLFDVKSVDSSYVLGTSSTETNIYSHYIGGSSPNWTNYEYSGRLRYTSTGGGIGLTFYSQYPDSDAYYRLRAYSGGSMHLSPHPDGQTVSGGVTDTGISLASGVWYRFRIQVESLYGGTRINIRAKVWLDGDSEPVNWQVDCYDVSSTRYTSGTVGVWTMNTGEKYFDDLIVQPLP
ncbi:MAG: pilus assembly protein [Anaerolineales bacterium]|nr:pilus assembly protein [Anaerolineales bacterium]